MQPVPSGSRPSWSPSSRHRPWPAACTTCTSSLCRCRRMVAWLSNGIRTRASCRSPTLTRRHSRARQLLPLPCGLSLWRFRAANHADLAIAFEVRGLHFGKTVDALLAQLRLKLVHGDELVPQVAALDHSIPDEQQSTRRREPAHGNEVEGKDVEQPVPADNRQHENGSFG